MVSSEQQQSVWPTVTRLPLFIALRSLFTTHRSLFTFKEENEARSLRKTRR